MTPWQLCSSAWRRLFHDVYVDARKPVNHRLLCQALSLRLPDAAVVTGRSAAQLWGAKLEVESPIEILSPSRMRQLPGTIVRVGSVPADERSIRFGVPVSDVEHTAWEIARVLPTLDAIGWIDALARARRVSRPALVAHARRHFGEHGCRRALETLRLSDPRAESPPESIVRVTLLGTSLPMPIPQFTVVWNGFFVARVDFGWPEIRLALEYDGQWHAGRQQLAADRERLRNLSEAGWQVFPITWSDMRDLGTLMRRIERAYYQRSREM